MPTSLVQRLRIDAAELPSEAVLFGSSPAMREVLSRVERVLHTDLPVLICGERGTGKETVARFLHVRSDRRDAPFMKVSCAGIAAGELESELLGGDLHGFGGIDSVQRGLAEAAAGGTLFLDEIDEIGWAAQSRLLNLLSETQCGGPGMDPGAGVRIICATSSDLEKAVARRAFREDLFYRIEVIHLHLKPLRERRQDIPRLCEHLLEKLSGRLGRTVPPLSPRAIQELEKRNWPGNLRELENWIARRIVLGSDRSAAGDSGRRVRELPTPESRRAQKRPTRNDSRPAVWANRATILQALRNHGGNRRRAALELNMSYRSLLSLLRENGTLWRDGRRQARHKRLPLRNNGFGSNHST